jgi:hypothetical protein
MMYEYYTDEEENFEQGTFYLYDGKVNVNSDEFPVIEHEV